jgi:hypothetical protein
MIPFDEIESRTVALAHAINIGDFWVLAGRRSAFLAIADSDNGAPLSLDRLARPTCDADKYVISGLE